MIKEFEQYQKVSIIITIAAKKAPKQIGLTMLHADNHWHGQNTAFFHKIVNDAGFATVEGRKVLAMAKAPEKWKLSPMSKDL